MDRRISFLFSVLLLALLFRPALAEPDSRETNLQHLRIMEEKLTRLQKSESGSPAIGKLVKEVNRVRAYMGMPPLSQKPAPPPQAQSQARVWKPQDFSKSPSPEQAARQAQAFQAKKEALQKAMDFAQKEFLFTKDDALSWATKNFGNLSDYGKMDLLLKQLELYFQWGLDLQTKGGHGMSPADAREFALSSALKAHHNRWTLDATDLHIALERKKKLREAGPSCATRYSRFEDWAKSGKANR